MGSVAQLKRIYTNADSMGNKKEELEAIVQQLNYDVGEISQRHGGMTCAAGALR